MKQNRKYSIKELWGLVNRIKTIEQVKIADDFITKHFPTNDDGSWDVDTFNALIEGCWQKADEIWHPERYY